MSFLRSSIFAHFPRLMSPKIVKPRNGKVSLPEDNVCIPEYYFENGLRKVKPYQQVYLARVKQRWIKRTVPEIFASEMPRRCTKDMISAAMKRGDVLINDKEMEPDYLLKGHESLRSRNCHRHEPPIPDTPIRVIEQTKDYVVFDKPHGITVHPNELMHFNTALEILRRDHDVPSYMHAVNRLDAVTSGIVIMANLGDPNIRLRFQPPEPEETTTKGCTDQESESVVQPPRVQKEYLCRVVGEFPESVIVKEPILQSGGKVSVDASGKPSETRFQRVWYDTETDTSLVSCFLSTGRQHQIRLHAAHLQHPIVNDKLYNPDYEKRWRVNCPDATPTGETRFYPSNIPSESQPYMPYYVSEETPCHKCREEEEGRNEPNPKDMKIWLRAIRYQGPDWKFETDLPDWADPRVFE
ncbi:RNA pseudouridylate synthase domain containing protein 2 [Lunasporangiospora selenospora]|uniref:RNA pseudouridylate synthase domain containing protein 2 n=1 Tax=Lunasporangiospora selenospora TaxID=979761 RepID=A0A9P6G1X2_9FUNG|nr:RNA pseudouridylate synthase domain containing protein 2 [Lunasporangiospora selenospora]